MFLFYCRDSGYSRARNRYVHERYYQYPGVNHTNRRGDKVPVAAGKIHTDMEKGFIRMEVMGCDYLIELGSETAVIKAGKQRIEGKTYEVQEGDVVVVLFN